MAYVYQQVRDTAAAWTAANPVLPPGILAYETDTLKWKLGDGVTAWNSLGYLTIGEATELLTRLKTVDGASSGLDADLLDGQHGSYYAAASTHVHRNHLINGDFSIAQRGTSFTGGTANADDVYTLDRWYILSDGNDIVDVTQDTANAPTNQLTCIALDVETINKKFGIAQIIEQKNCVGLIGNTVTLSFKAKVSATTKLDNVKAAIIAWSGTADTVTSDMISAWGNEGVNPTLIANATYENTPANLNVTTDWATYSITATIDTASTANVIVFLWSDVTDTTLGDFLYLTDVQLETGNRATGYERRSFGQELALCQRYYEKSYPYPTSPGSASSGHVGNYGSSISDGYIGTFIEFKVSKRSITGAVVTFYTLAGVAGSWEYVRNGASGSATPSATNQVTENGMQVYFSIGAGWAVATVYGHYTISCEL